MSLFDVFGIGQATGLAAAYQAHQQRQRQFDHQYLANLLGTNLYPTGYLGTLYGQKVYTSPSRLVCAYCGNNYAKEVVASSRNCPTCAGSWK